jgi:hypothetical protein
MSTAPAKIGHNSDIDFDLATDFVDVGPLSGRKDLDPKQLANFRHAIRTQGNNNIRQRAISCMLERARANAALSHAEFRVLDRMAERCRGGFRYTTEPQDTLGFYCGIEHRQNVSRVIPNLIDLGFVVGIEVPSPSGGRPRRYYTVVCTGGDRAGTSRSDLAFEARRRNLELMDDAAATRLANAIIGEMEAKKQAQSKHQHDALGGETERPMHNHDASTGAKHNHDALPMHNLDALKKENKNNDLDEAKHNLDALSGSLHPQGAKHHHDDVSISNTSLDSLRDRDSPLESLPVERGVRGENLTQAETASSPAAPRSFDAHKTKSQSRKVAEPTKAGAQKAKAPIPEFDLQPIPAEAVEVLNPEERFGAAATRSRKPKRPGSHKSGKHPFLSLSEEERKEVLMSAQTYGEARGWPIEFVRDRVREFLVHQRANKPFSLDWMATMELWIGAKKPSTTYGTAPSRSRIIDDAMDAAFGKLGDDK